MRRIDRRVRAGLAALLLAGLAACHASQPDAPVAFGGPFELTAPNGRTVSSASLKGKPYAIFFGYTRCPDVCPTTLARMARLRKQLGRDGDKFAIVFVSVDPEHDKPEDLGRYVALFGTPVIGLTGDKQHLAQAVKNFGVYYERVPQPGGDYTIDHSAAVYLMDRDGAFVSTIDHEESDQMALAKLKRLVG